MLPRAALLTALDQPGDLTITDAYPPLDPARPSTGCMARVGQEQAVLVTVAYRLAAARTDVYRDAVDPRRIPVPADPW